MLIKDYFISTSSILVWWLVLWIQNIGFTEKTNYMSSLDLVPLKKWEEGYLDIHHINTGSGNACFIIFPDGTSMLFDAGNLDKQGFEQKRAPLKTTAPIPSDSLSPAGWIARYIQKMHPDGKNLTIDYVVVSHFHGDHYGSLVELSNLIPINNIIDRNYPVYNFPIDLRKHLSDNQTFQHYLKLMESGAVKGSSLIAGKSNQIVLLRAPKAYQSFKVTNVKANSSIWTGNKDQVKNHFTAQDMTNYYNGKYNENPLSLALKISYGKFDYYTGGDNTGLQGYGMPEWFDVETPMARSVGKVEAMTLNHHGNRDATNENFVDALNPKIVVQQLWCSDHPGQEVYQRLIYRDSLSESRSIFSTNMHPETLTTYGPWFRDSYESTQGHVLIRVLPNGNQSNVYIIDEETLLVRNTHGPYLSE